MGIAFSYFWQQCQCDPDNGYCGNGFWGCRDEYARCEKDNMVSFVYTKRLSLFSSLQGHFRCCSPACWRTDLAFQRLYIVYTRRRTKYSQRGSVAAAAHASEYPFALYPLDTTVCYATKTLHAEVLSPFLNSTYVCMHSSRIADHTFNKQHPCTMTLFDSKVGLRTT
jgi:hypothetical protein